MPRIAVGWLSREVLFLAYLPQRFPAAGRLHVDARLTFRSRPPFHAAIRFQNQARVTMQNRAPLQIHAKLQRRRVAFFSGGVLANTVHRLASVRRHVANATAVSPRSRETDAMMS